MALPIRKNALIETERLTIKPYASEDAARLEYGVYLDGKLIGFVNDCGIEDGEIEIGYVIHPGYPGHGYATEALKKIRGIKPRGL